MGDPLRQPLTLEWLRSKLFDPGLVFYRPAVLEILRRGEFAEIQALRQGALEVKESYGDLDGLIKELDTALKRAQSS